MEFATEYILTKALTLTESIVRRVCQKAGDQARTRPGSEGNRTLDDVMGAIEKETAQILDCLASQQQSKVDSAYQYIKFAMSDLQAWNEELNSSGLSTPSYYSQTSRQSEYEEKEKAVRVSPLQMSPNFKIVATQSSKCFRDAMWQLRRADEWATEAFNDKKNSKAYVRIEALHIRLFCRALLDWDNKRLWFAKWRQVLEPLFCDRQFVRYAMGEQSFASRLFSDERAKPVGERFVQLTKSLEKLIWSMLLKEPTLAPYAREFAIYFDKNTTLAPDVKLSNEWSGLRTLHLTYFDLNQDIEVKLCADRLMIRLYEFKAITPSFGDQVWAIEHGGRLVSFDAKEPETQTMVINDGRKWLQIDFDGRQKIYATSENDDHVSVFDAASGSLIEKEKIELPKGPSQSYAYQLRATRNGALFLGDKGNGKGFVRFSDDRNWCHLSKGDYDAVLSGADRREIIGVKLRGYYFEADVIRKHVEIDNQNQNRIDEASVCETIRERIYLPNEPQKCLLTVGEIDTDNFSDFDRKITIACETEKLNYMIMMGAKFANDGKTITAFPVKDVCSFDPKYTDWKMAKEMIEADNKLFALFR